MIVRMPSLHEFFEDELQRTNIDIAVVGDVREIQHFITQMQKYDLSLIVREMYMHHTVGVPTVIRITGAYLNVFALYMSLVQRYDH